MSQLTMADFKKWYIDDPTNKKSLQTQKDTINQAADASNQLLQDTYDMGVADTQRDYAEQFDANAVQRMINERQIAESMANAGLTNSGMNASQMTANQLSYGNQNAKLRREQQSAIDTLAATLRQGRLANELQRNQKLAEADINYNNAANEYASGMVTEQNKAIKDANKTLADEKASARKELLDVFKDTNVDDEAKKQAYNRYISTYGADANDSIIFSPYTSKWGTVTDDGRVTYTEDDVAKYKRLWNSRNVDEKTFDNQFADFAVKNSLTDKEVIEFAKAVKGGSSRDTLGTVNPTEYTYTLIDKGDPDGTDFKEKYGVDNDEWGDLVLDAVVEDEFGVRRTISDIFHNARLYYIRQEHEDKGDWATWSKKGTNLENALRDEGSDAWDKALKAVEGLQEDLKITD